MSVETGNSDATSVWETVLAQHFKEEDVRRFWQNQGQELVSTYEQMATFLRGSEFMTRFGTNWAHQSDPVKWPGRDWERAVYESQAQTLTAISLLLDLRLMKRQEVDWGSFGLGVTAIEQFRKVTIQLRGYFGDVLLGGNQDEI